VVTLILANCAVFIYQMTLPPLQYHLLAYKYGAIPALLLSGDTLVEVLPPDLRQVVEMSGVRVTPLQPIWISLFTSMFLHSDLLHLGTNMLYFWIFGNNVEDVLGHFRFLLFYLVCGLIAACAQILMGVRSPIPMIGASGAIAGVLGGYYVKFPHARVQCFVFLLIFFTVVWLPAGLMLLLWFLLQVLYGLQSGGPYAGQGGVAFFAHIGGFVAGMALLRRFLPRRGRLRLADWSDRR
jgi:membrane associated rhomboid family serine protease